VLLAGGQEGVVVLDGQFQPMLDAIRDRDDRLADLNEGLSVLRAVSEGIAAQGPNAQVSLDTKVTFRTREATLGDVATALALPPALSRMASSARRNSHPASRAPEPRLTA
jgi:hypothetical protein